MQHLISLWKPTKKTLLFLHTPCSIHKITSHLYYTRTHIQKTLSNLIFLYAEKSPKNSMAKINISYANEFYFTKNKIIQITQNALFLLSTFFFFLLHKINGKNWMVRNGYNRDLKKGTTHKSNRIRWEKKTQMCVCDSHSGMTWTE